MTYAQRHSYIVFAGRESSACPGEVDPVRRQGHAPTQESTALSDMIGSAVESASTELKQAPALSIFERDASGQARGHAVRVRALDRVGAGICAGYDRVTALAPIGERLQAVASCELSTVSGIPGALRPSVFSANSVRPLPAPGQRPAHR